MSILQIQLLGDFRVVYGENVVTDIHQTRLQSLLAYLLLHGQTPQSRQRVAFLFWPDTTERQARTNLRRELYHLRQALPNVEQYLHADTKVVQWLPGAPFTLDVGAFEELLQQASQAAKAGRQAAVKERLESALEQYQGRLLPNCYDDWILPERERLEQRFTRALEDLILLLEDQRDYATAIHHAQRLLRHDPLHEPTYRRLMRLHALNGDRVGALRLYHTCADILARELGVDPNQETQDAHARLLNLETPQKLRTPTLPAVHAAAQLIGRQAEWQQLRAAWRKALGGQAHLLLIGGEAGIGKTRLAEELYTSVSQQGIITARTRSYAAEGALAYAPVIEWLRSPALRSTLEKLDDPWLTEVARLLPELLVARPDLRHPEPLSERWQRQRLFEALARAIFSDDQPRLLVIDDLQWCDPETLAWLRYLLRFASHARLLIIGTVRPDEIDADHPLTSLTLELRNAMQLTAVDLEPLDPDDTARLAAQAAAQELDAVALAQIYQETEGNPLFIVETVRARVEGQGFATGEQGERTHHSPLATHPYDPAPPKVQAVIQARLAQLSPQGRELAGLAATIGRSFTFAVLLQASAVHEDVVVQGLDELWQRRIVREQGADAYDFSHDRIREAAYAEIGVAHRRLLHRRVAEALANVRAGALDDVSGQIAVHFDRAGLPTQAISYYQRAGETARRLYANLEACTLLRSGLALIKTLPEHSEREERELALQRALGISLSAVKGVAHEEVKEVYLRAQQLCRQLGQAPDTPILRGLASVFAVRGELRTAQEIALELMALAQGAQIPEQLMEAHYALGVNYGWMGDFPAARHHLEQVIAHYDPGDHRIHTVRYGQDPGVTGRIRLALVLWFLGYPDRAIRCAEESLALAHEIAHPLSNVYAMLWHGKLHEHLRNATTTLNYAEKTLVLATEHDFPLWASQGTVHRGWALAELGNPAEGLAQIQAGMTAHEQTGARAPRPWHLALLATAYGKLGRFTEALGALDEALALAEENGILDCQAERWRLKGELTLQSAILSPGSALQSEAEACFLKAIEIARSQHAKSLELRAVMSLSRLWQNQGKQAEAHQMLTEIYDWFTEGFSTPDLQAAQALLNELKNNP